MKPNFLIFVVDQMASRSLGCNGHPEVRTPNIDRLAAAGTSFRRAYCNNPVCQPSRATMLTGLTPRQHGLVSNGNALDGQVPTVTGALAASGYRTHSVGKLHLQPFVNIARNCDPDDPVESCESEYAWRQGRVTSLPPDYYGFQTTDFLGGHGYYSFGDYSNWLNRAHPDPASLYADGNTQGRFKPDTAKHLPPELHYNHWIADRTIAFLDDCAADQPFFLWCSFPDPHHPFSANRQYADLYEPGSLTLNKTWQLTEETCPHLASLRRERPVLTEDYLREITAETYGMITHIDEQIGRVMTRLEQDGRDRNTVVVFMSDHGEYLGSHGLHQKSVWPYEELDRIPFLWKTPGTAADTSDAVVSLLDFVPTILDYAGLPAEVLDRREVKPENGRFLPGRSLRPWLDRGEHLAERPALIEFERAPGAGPRTLVETRWKFTFFPPTGHGLLFDLETDPHETRNLWDEPACAREKARLGLRLLEELAMSDRLDHTRIANA
jgi:arylsulfatase A-like enzyme